MLELLTVVIFRRSSMLKLLYSLHFSVPPQCAMRLVAGNRPNPTKLCRSGPDVTCEVALALKVPRYLLSTRKPEDL